MESVFSLSYCSVSQGCADNVDRRIDQRVILKTALKKNGALGLTGALLCGSNFYAQILEGDRDAVIRTFGRIQADQRHTAIKLLSAEQVSQRRFALWSMAGIDLSGSQNSSVERIMSRAHSGEKAVLPLLYLLMTRLVQSEPMQLRSAGSECEAHEVRCFKVGQALSSFQHSLIKIDVPSRAYRAT